MTTIQKAHQWALTHTFSEEELRYATILTLKILDQKCQMTQEDQTIFMAVYDGIANKTPTPLTTSLHKLIVQSRNHDHLACHASAKQTITFHRQEAEGEMQRPIMKRYKSMVRQALDLSLVSD